MSVTIRVTIRRHTDKAVLVEHDGADIWLPKSQIESRIPAAGENGEIDISDWIAEQKDLITSGVERYVVEQFNSAVAPNAFVVKDMSTNPVHIMCTCGNARDANIIAASLELTKNKI